MIKNDIRYIIKKILIGIGICIGLFYFKSCNVHALTLTDRWYELRDVTNGSFNNSYFSYYPLNTEHTYVINGVQYIVKYDSSYITINGYSASTNNGLCGNKQCQGYIIAKDNVTDNVYFLVKTNNVNQLFEFASTNSQSSFPITINRLATSGSGNSFVGGGMIVFDSSGQLISRDINYTNDTYKNNCNINGYQYHCISNNSFDIYGSSLRLSFKNWTYSYSSDFVTPVIVPPNNPEIVSLNARLNKTDSDMLVSVSFFPEFSFIDTDNYNYYAWFEGEKKFLLTENNINFNTQQNTIFYVEITDKEGNTIDTQTYSVTSIGLIYNGDYDIQFVTTELTNSDTTNDSDLVIDEINRIDIDITYIPKWVNYKYQYQWVNQNDSLTNNWVTINNNSDKNNYTYTTRVNGTLHTRILDINNNVLKSSSYTITRIGQLKTYDKNSGRIFNMFNNLNNDINFGGPISNLIILPVNVLETILQAGGSLCSPYYLGTIGGHPLTLTCVNPEDYLGSSLWSLIDIIVSGCLIYSIAKWLTSLYWNFVMLQNTPDINPETMGDRRDLL